MSGQAGDAISSSKFMTIHDVLHDWIAFNAWIQVSVYVPFLQIVTISINSVDVSAA